MPRKKLRFGFVFIGSSVTLALSANNMAHLKVRLQGTRQASRGRCASKIKIIKENIKTLRHCEGNPPVAGRFPTQRASNAENVSIWWRHHVPRADDISTTKQSTVNTWAMYLGCTISSVLTISWWRHNIQMFSTLLVLCGGIQWRLVDSPPKGSENIPYNDVILRS